MLFRSLNSWVDGSKEISKLLELPLGRPREIEKPHHQHPPSVHVVRVSDVNRAAVAGSFVLTVRAVVNNVDTIVGTESVLSRWKVSGCTNCQTHLGVKTFVPLVGLDKEALSTIRVGLHGRGKSVADLNSDPNTGGSWQIGKMEIPHGMASV